MAYIINLTNGTQLASVEDGTIDQSTTLKLVGKNYAGYGEIQNENFVHLLENFLKNLKLMRQLKEPQMQKKLSNNCHFIGVVSQ